MFTALNRNKRIFMELAAQSDVIVENNRAGVMDRLDLGYEAVRTANPQIISASISGFGQTGPYRERGGYDTIARGMSGMMSAAGNEGMPPAKAGAPVVDIMTSWCTPRYRAGRCTATTKLSTTRICSTGKWPLRWSIPGLAV